MDQGEGTPETGKRQKGKGWKEGRKGNGEKKRRERENGRRR